MHKNADYEMPSPSFLFVSKVEKRSIKNNASLHNKSYFIRSVLGYIDKTYIYTFFMFITKSCEFLT